MASKTPEKPDAWAPKTRAGRIGSLWLRVGLIFGYAAGLSLPSITTLSREDILLASLTTGHVAGAFGALVGWVTTQALPLPPPVTDPARRSAITWWRTVAAVAAIGGIVLVAATWRGASEALMAATWPVGLVLGAHACTESIARRLRPIGLPAVFALLAAVPLIALIAVPFSNPPAHGRSVWMWPAIGGALVFSVVAFTAVVKTLRVGGWFGGSRIRFF